jgi:hypothetical protein
MDSTETPAAPTTLYINVASMVAKAPSSTPSCPQNGRNDGTGGNQTKYNNKNRNSGNDDGNNDKNSNDSGGCGGSSGQTTAPTGSASMTNTLWPSYGQPWQGHMTMYPGLMPAEQQCLQAFVATLGLYMSPSFLSGPQPQ